MILLRLVVLGAFLPPRVTNVGLPSMTTLPIRSWLAKNVTCCLC